MRNGATMALEATETPQDRRSRNIAGVDDVQVVLTMNLLEQAENLRGACELWERWAKEWCRGGYDIAGFVQEYIDGFRNGRTCLVVAVNAMGQTVGMVTLNWNYDTANGWVRAVGERLYVSPEHRDMGVFRNLWRGAEMFAELVGAKEHVISTTYGSPLQKLYEKAGFIPTDVILKRRV